MYHGGAAGPEDALRLAGALDEEEQELWRQLRRKRDFEARVAEKRAQLAELRDRRRGVGTARSEAKASVEHLTNELAFAEEQRRDLEHDIAVLKESNRILQQAMFQHDQQEHRDWDAQHILAEEKKRQESVALQHEQIEHLRTHVEKLRAEKANLQQRQQVLFERQRSAEQDRNRLLGTLQDERSAINEVRQERIKLWEERTKMEQEMAEIVRRAAMNSAGGGTTSQPDAPGRPVVPGASGGVRGRVTQDTPQVFADTTKMGSQSPGAGEPPASARTGWTSFGADGAAKSGVGGAFPGGSMGSGAAVPPSFGDLTSAPGGGGGGGITEWAGKMRDFRSGVPAGGGGGGF